MKKKWWIALVAPPAIVLFVWGFGEGNISRRNFCRAYLILFAIGLGLAMIIFTSMLVFGGIFAGVFNRHH